MAPWVKKTTEEYKKDLFRWRFSLSIPIWAFVMLFIFFVVLEKFGPEFLAIYHAGPAPTDEPSELLSWLELVKELPLIFFISLLFTAGIYIIQILWGSFLYSPSTMTCDKCKKHKARNELPNLQCRCGGTYVDIRRMKWVEKSGEVRSS